jgi:hypothetical protein
MGNFPEIWRRNRDTFYDDRDGSPSAVWPRLLVEALLSALLALLLATPTSDFIDSVITVQSILVGFAFSVLFFIVSSDRVTDIPGPSLENKARLARLNKLSDELFYNVSYYTAVNVVSLMIALSFRFPGLSNFGNTILEFDMSSMVSPFLKAKVDNLLILTGYIYEFFFFLLLIESGYTFYRIVVRVNFYFTEKRRLSMT